MRRTRPVFIYKYILLIERVGLALTYHKAISYVRDCFYFQYASILIPDRHFLRKIQRVAAQYRPVEYLMAKRQKQ